MIIILNFYYKRIKEYKNNNHNIMTYEILKNIYAPLFTFPDSVNI